MKALDDYRSLDEETKKIAEQAKQLHAALVAAMNEKGKTTEEMAELIHVLTPHPPPPVEKNSTNYRKLQKIFRPRIWKRNSRQRKPISEQINLLPALASWKCTKNEPRIFKILKNV
jgi:hypothetical protein